MSSLIANLISELNDALNRDDHQRIWANPGVRELDSKSAAVADYYIKFPTERETVRVQLRELDSLWGLVLLVRRAGLLTKTENGALWLNRGLAVASMVDANCDYRDLIVSLVVLRSLAENAGLQTNSAFDNAIAWSTERMLGILTNARNHSPSNIQSTLASFGPPPVIETDVR